ncbi:MAG: hypothetical protein KME21_10835 [Desmonostoc vinosum HA7617-LM4]|nr:hypothetical protein [Desmonostoc vinosum HA7617-LM4]
MKRKIRIFSWCDRQSYLSWISRWWNSLNYDFGYFGAFISSWLKSAIIHRSSIYEFAEPTNIKMARFLLAS